VVEFDMDIRLVSIVRYDKLWVRCHFEGKIGRAALTSNLILKTNIGFNKF
jgi:hypothetical protein